MCDRFDSNEKVEEPPIFATYSAASSVSGTAR